MDEKTPPPDPTRQDRLEQKRANFKRRYAADPEKFRAEAKAYYYANLEKVREAARIRERARRAADPEKYRARDRAKHHANPDKKRSSGLKYLYGITLEKYAEMVAAQGGKCAICGSAPVSHVKNDRLHVDHDHADPEKIRALLCRGCNTGLGNFRDSIPFLEAAICYLRAHGNAQSD